MTVLVDTSVWIRFLSDRSPYGAHMQRLLNHNEVAGHDLVYGELLMGDRGGRRELLKSYDTMPRISDVPHREVVEFVRAHAFHGLGIGWIDAHLLASALVADVPLWTADDQLARMAGELGIGYVLRT